MELITKWKQFFFSLQFYSLLEQDSIANSTLALRACTVFVPTNAAFQKFKGTPEVLYHISKYYRRKKMKSKNGKID